MMSIPRYANKHLLLATLVGAIIGYGACKLTADQLPANKSPEQKSAQAELRNTEQGNTEDKIPEPMNTALDIEQLRKDLSTRFIGDPRTLGEKLRDFVAENPDQQSLAIACKVVADLAENSAALSNQELRLLYQNQIQAGLKRVVAQVLSLRGDNSLMELLIGEAQPALTSSNPTARRKVLAELAKTHYAGAANAIAPLIKDEDISVKLDALLALRATGNESHISALEKLVNDPNESVSWLANDVINSLQNLSTKARTKLTSADIAAELPPITTH